jgi:hypothetical protein
MPRPVLWLVLFLTLAACSLPSAAQRLTATPLPTPTDLPDASEGADAVDPAEADPADTNPDEGAAPTSTPLPPTSTPTPTQGQGAPLPTSTPLPSPTPTSTPVPTVIPPTPEAMGGTLPGGWFAFSRTVQVIPNDPSPSAYGCHLIVRRTDGPEERDLTPVGINCVEAEAISPDGGQVAFVSGYVRNFSAGLNGDLMVARLDGGGVTRLVPSTGSPTWIVWSRDGGQIANYFNGDFKWHVYDVVEGGAEVEALDALTPDRWALPNLSPNGQFRASACEADLAAGVRRPCVTALADDPRPLGSVNLDAGFVWTPDGEWIVYAGEDGTYAAHPDGSGVTRVTADTGAWWFE